jgi:hypothetical protein
VSHRDTEATEEEERRIRKILTFLLLCVFSVSSVPLWFKSPGSLSNPAAGVLRLRGAMVVMDIRSRLMAVCCLTLEGTMYASILWGDRKKATGDVETLWQRVAAQPGLVTAYPGLFIKAVERLRGDARGIDRGGSSPDGV